MIPQLLLEEILLGEKDAKNYYSKYGKEELESALEGLRKSNQEILSAYPKACANPTKKFFPHIRPAALPSLQAPPWTPQSKQPDAPQTRALQTS